MKLKKIEYKLRRTESRGLVHDGRQDIRYVSGAVNDLIDKINELVDEIHLLKTNNK